MEIRLDLSRHCIQTAARLKLEHLIRQCLKAPDQETEEMIETLTDFLSLNDFGELRRRIDLARKAFEDSSAPLVPLDLPDDMLKPFSRLTIAPAAFYQSLWTRHLPESLVPLRFCYQRYIKYMKIFVKNTGKRTSPVLL